MVSANGTAPQRAIGSFVSLYSGAGGLDLGFVAAGFEPLWANDADHFAVETYNKLVPGHVAVEGPIERHRLPHRGSADLVIGGPPCQGFSVGGHMDPQDPRNQHVMTFLDAVARIRPRAFVMENVKALANHPKWIPVRDALLTRASQLGYQTQMLILNAADFGTPQSRERMFLIGLHCSTSVVPEPTTSDQRPTVRSALGTLPPWGQPGNSTLCEARITPAKRPVIRRSPHAGMLFNGSGRPLHLDRPAPTLTASMGGNRTPIIDQRQLERGGPSWVERYHKRLVSGHSPVRRVPSFLRRITVEEAAALQTFPPGSYWAGPVSAQYRQIGNAVPPALAHGVAVALARAVDPA